VCEREREREREGGGGERDRQTDRERERGRDRQTERAMIINKANKKYLTPQIIEYKPVKEINLFWK
jgi:hypothetical protein